jgi:hypothetical protein
MNAATDLDFERAVAALSDGAAFKAAVTERLGGSPLLYRDPARVAEKAANRLHKIAMRGGFGTPAYRAVKELQEAAQRRCQSARRA